MTGVL